MDFKDKIAHLKQSLGHLEDYNQRSRVHQLKLFNPNCFVKRDDELSFGISGSKLRKYTSLIPFLEKNNTQEVIVIGGAYSNNVLGLSQLLIEHSIKPTLFLLGDSTSAHIGNFLLTSLFVPESSIHWVAREEWGQVESLAKDYAHQSSESVVIIPEGALMPEALPGAMTLALDILRNEEKLGDSFAHLFLEAGSGLTAIAAILAFAWLERPTCVHVLLLADNEQTFIHKLESFRKHFEQLIAKNLSWESIKERFKLHIPTMAKSFGSVNKTILQKVREIARLEGFLTDPVYSVKLFLEAEKIIKEQGLRGSILIVHSGGGLTLMGFQEQLQSLKVITN
jgi:1-aminocyclopropane-1-carboxylate deaminase